MLAVTISVDNRRLVVRLVPAGTMTEAEVLKLGYKFDFRFFQLKLEAFSISLHRFAALARRQLVPGSVRLWGRVEVRRAFRLLNLESSQVFMRNFKGTRRRVG